jgi:esterase/lipase
MQFYSGFSLQNEEYLFDDYIKKSDFTICGFSYGAIKAFKATQNELEKGRRVDTLLLLSPAFFQTKDEKFKRLQLISYKKNKDAYMDQFLNACFAPYEKKIVEYTDTSINDLQDLLNYKWDIKELQDLINKDVVIEVYLGSDDKIIDVKSARDFFLKVSTLTYLKNANHFLQTN